MPPSGMPPSVGMPLSIGRLASVMRASTAGASTPGVVKHRPACSAEAHQPSSPQTWPGAQSAAAVQRATHSPKRGW
jgi:hypothetical protein